jgi:ubiquinone/menaquinone biosynthesis C-methylase UbiE
LSKVEASSLVLNIDGLPQTIAERTRRIYDRLARLYPISTFLFHSRAHRCALDMSGVHNGMHVLEVATGSGEMFRRLVKANHNGATVGFDLSPNMAALTHRRVRREFPEAKSLCQAVDARYMPFRDESFDVVVCCYLLELLATEDILQTLHEFRRVLKTRGRLALVLIGQNTPVFNRIYKFCGAIAPAFWGRQVEERVPEFIEAMNLRILRQRMVRQTFYPSRVLLARK